MRQAFVHVATVELGSGADQQALGAAVTVELCGAWEHDGACRWPHNTAVTARDGSSVTIRTIFASDPAEELAVRERIANALRTEHLDAPDGASRWRLRTDAPAGLRPDDQPLAERLRRGPRA